MTTIHQEIRGEMKKLPQSNENKNTIYQNFWDIAREV
jgi:hypothetical protein